MSRVYNFSPGPAMLPDAVLETAQRQMLDWNGTGMSVMEVSHRSAAFEDLLAQTKQQLRDLMSIPENYHILFMTSGARGQFAAVPMNLLTTNSKANYVVSGLWSDIAANEAEKYGEIHRVFNYDSPMMTTIPAFSSWDIEQGARYLYYTPNETVIGLEIPYTPQCSMPLIADMTSCILAKEYDVSEFGLIYASAQKNLGQAGVTLVIIRDDLLDKAQSITPEVFNYQTYASTNSLYNTPPTYAIYIMNLVLEHLQQCGGVAEIAALNQQKSSLLYDFIDNHPFYQNKVQREYRSSVNVSFDLLDSDLNQQFLQQASQHGLCNLKGHSSFGGMRASLYNAMPLAGVEKLTSFMYQFAKEHQ